MHRSHCDVFGIFTPHPPRVPSEFSHESSKGVCKPRLYLRRLGTPVLRTPTSLYIFPKSLNSLQYIIIQINIHNKHAYHILSEQFYRPRLCFRFLPSKFLFATICEPRCLNLIDLDLMSMVCLLRILAANLRIC